MKNKIAKIFFYISLAPYVLLLLISIYSAFDGFGILGNISYGYDGFISAFIILGFVFFFLYPVFPVCLIYQLIYLFVLKKKFQNHEQETQ